MLTVTLAGAPSVGKTAVIGHLVRALLARGRRPAAVKFDTRSSSDADRLAALHGIPTIGGLSGYLCPDHFLASNLEEAMDWGRDNRADVLLIETAGLCLRCAPHVEGVPAVTVVDCLGGIDVPGKMGPMLASADIVLVTKGDLVSQAEREVFIHALPKAAPDARIIPVNGLSGSGIRVLARCLEGMGSAEPGELARLRHDMPASICSYCTGERRIGRRYQTGNVEKLVWRGR
ncbi:MAG: hypothetical protein F8N37_07470 [Telmatospirillum sp.]|nr:hypothetical protein [Telmatospirillum sp.]